MNAIPLRWPPGFALCALLIALGCGDTNETDPPPDEPDPTACEGSATRCDGQCIDLDSNASHCGACSSACEAGASCEAGECVTAVPACEDERASLCDEDCVLLDSDTAHCGSCDNACRPGQTCNDGSCEGPPPFDECEAQVSGTLLTSLSNIAVENATVVNASVRHAFDVDEVASQGCVDSFEVQVQLNDPGCTL
ncbi:MAG: hypothetical protein AAF997_24360, partial [Myxococcota bacterium]